MGMLSGALEEDICGFHRLGFLTLWPSPLTSDNLDLVPLTGIIGGFSGKTFVGSRDGQGCAHCLVGLA